MTYPTKLVSVSIAASAGSVYRFASNPKNLPQWASGLSSGVREENGAWVTDSPMGKVTVKFAAENAFGVLDHDVTLPSGQTFYNPMRVQPNGDGCEVIFTLYRRPEMSEKEFQDDLATIEGDLAKLKSLLDPQAKARS